MLQTDIRLNEANSDRKPDERAYPVLCSMGYFIYAGDRPPVPVKEALSKHAEYQPK
ncbi:MAG: hypothetical protein HYW26_00230 [Candidatus Aenigmarchaeota archaeon]|nr:hypothetical protein [Candidatus Aenigmarchaeota archaeon]